jgi:Oxidoreductase family, NAD-binding Rossmann fold
MPDQPSYVIFGRGRWAQRMHSMLSRESRRVSMIGETRRRPDESEFEYQDRIGDAMRRSGAAIAWLCVLPGPHVALMIRAALEGGLDVIVEKPWTGSQAETEELEVLARDTGKLIAVDYEYLVHPAVEEWKKRFYPGADLDFAANFFLSRSDRTGIPAISNLGTHLFSIREYAVPASSITQIQCAYEQPDERLVWLEQHGKRIATIDLQKDAGRLVQSYLEKIEAARGSAAFTIDLRFASRVARELAAYEA